MGREKLDEFSLTLLDGGMPRPKSDGDNMIFLGFKVPPQYKAYLPTIVEAKNEDFPATVARRLFLRGFAAYLQDGELWTEKEREVLRDFTKQWEGAREIDVNRPDVENDSSRSTGRG